ncbi:methylamine utilization protein [Stratiformator vulcanicus]|uniref:Rhamnogalacturonan lyase domain-containing protein n=1 Tax=Stratiformator vulcanicus TaxID=2527980 RepID=A0A517R7T0_9PLAN|nr:methylamine utilization protein [Stratiformator vulcanicus]QDT39947.1 hypothetical protein Pan189_43590 [Stratiformator vulcanicus]
MRRSLLVFAIAATASFCLTDIEAHAEGWGNLTGQFVIKGDIPEPTFLPKNKINKDPAICAVNPIPENEVVIDQETGGVANVFVYWYGRRGAKPDVHPDLQDPPEEPFVFDNQGCVFVPHAAIVRVGQPLKFINSDGCSHNIHTYPLRQQADAINDLVSANATAEKEPLSGPDILPYPVKCDIHPWMNAFWYVSDHPYAAVSAKDGTFTIEKLPAGEHTFRLWQEKVGYVERAYKVTIKDGETTDIGKFEVEGLQ